MPNKAIFNIDVNSDSFKSFYEMFEDYRSKLEGMSVTWQNLETAMKDAGFAFAHGAGDSEEALGKSAKHAGSLSENMTDAAAGMNNFRLSAHQTHSVMKDLVHSAGSLGSKLFGIGRSLFKMSLLGTGLGILAGGFGMDSLANSAMNRQRTARGLGLSVGQAEAFRVNMGRYVGDNFLENTANMRMDMNNWGYLSALGIDPFAAQKRNLVGLSFDLINKIRSRWRHLPSSLQTAQYAQSQGYQKLGLSYDDLRRLAATPRAELMRRERASTRDIGGMALDDKTAELWSRLDIQLKRAGMVIETVLINKLALLAMPLRHLSVDLTNLLVKGLNSKEFRQFMKELPADLEKFAKFLGSKDFMQDLRNFKDAIIDVTKGILWITKKIDSGMPSIDQTAGLIPITDSGNLIGGIDWGKVESAAKKNLKGYFHGLEDWWGGSSPKGMIEKTIHNAPAASGKSKVSAPVHIRIHNETSSKVSHSINALAH